MVCVLFKTSGCILPQNRKKAIHDAITYGLSIIVIYLAMGMADLSVYVPFYHGLDAYPAHYGMGTNQADSQSLYWKYRKLQTLVMTDYPKLAPVVKEAYKKFEADTAVKQKAFEEDYLKIYPKGDGGS